MSREGLWRIMAKYGCPPKFITNVRLLHDGMMDRVQDDANSSDPFLVWNGVKEGCALAPMLVSMMFSAMLTDAFANTDTGIDIRHRMDSSVCNLRRLKAKKRSRQTPSMTSYLKMTVPWIPSQKMTCSRMLKNSLRPAPCYFLFAEATGAISGHPAFCKYVVEPLQILVFSKCFHAGFEAFSAFKFKVIEDTN